MHATAAKRTCWLCAVGRTGPKVKWAGLERLNAKLSNGALASPIGLCTTSGGNNSIEQLLMECCLPLLPLPCCRRCRKVVSEEVKELLTSTRVGEQC